MTYENSFEDASPGVVIQLETLRDKNRRLLSMKLEAQPDEADLYRRVRTLAESGARWAQYAVGRMLYSGKGAAEDKPQSLEWFRRAAEGGDSRGWVQLGSASELERGTQRDCAAEAQRWYRLLAKNAARPDQEDNVTSQYTLGSPLRWVQ